MNGKYKVVMIIDNDKEISIKENVDCILANKFKIFRENNEIRDNVEYKVVNEKA
ncbi:hypothetical protein ACFHWD_04005 [Clostridium sp. MT-14]|uniref:hypothetical protein n=1 Tax=Clostridium sp. MT-14 TaxID=3348360 RepID=UPI0035F31CC8